MLEFKNVTIAYDNHIVLENINLKINQGDVIGIIGPSGCGKSTLIRTMNHLVKPQKGEVLFEGKVITDKNVNQIREQIGMVFQQFELFPHLTVLENLTLAPVYLHKASKEKVIAEAKQYLSKVNLLDKIDTYPSTLSGGQKQRIAIIRSLLMHPKMMLFDEPTSALDPEMVKEVLQVIKEVAKSGMTVCIVTHEMKFAKDVANRILFIDEKKIVSDSAPVEFFENSTNERIRDFLAHFN